MSNPPFLKMPIRERKQIIINYRSLEKPYYVAIRVLTFNPNINQRMLIMIAMEKKRQLERQFGTTLKQMEQELGDESRQVDTSEDRQLNNTSIYVQIQIKKQIIDFEEIKT